MSPDMTKPKPNPGDISPDGKCEFGADGKWHRLDDIVWRNGEGLITGSW